MKTFLKWMLGGAWLLFCFYLGLHVGVYLEQLIDLFAGVK